MGSGVYPSPQPPGRPEPPDEEEDYLRVSKVRCSLPLHGTDVLRSPSGFPGGEGAAIKPIELLVPLG